MSSKSKSRTQELPKRRTIVNKAALAQKEQKQNRSSITSFFFGSKSVSTPTNPPAATNSIEHGKNRMGIFRATSSTSISSAVSDNSASSYKGSLKATNSGSVVNEPMVRAISRNISKKLEEDDIVANKAVDVALKLRLWESASSAESTPKAATRQSKRLNRDNSCGSQVSNISVLSNNSNISILSQSSEGSLVSGAVSASSSPRAATNPSPFNPAAAAALSRRRFYGEEPASSLDSHSTALPAISTAAPTASSASHALLDPSSSEPSPAVSPRLVEPSPAVNPEPTTTVLHRPVPVMVPKLSEIMPKPALKSPKMGMEALPDRSADLRSTRQSWVQGAAAATSPSALRAVKFSSSTKDMSALRGEGSCEVSNSSISGGGGGGGADVLVIEGATLVEEIEEVEEVEEPGEAVDVMRPLPSTVIAPASAVLNEPPMSLPLPLPMSPTIPLAELVLRNASRQYDGLRRQELESHLSDAEFTKVFRMKRESFYQLSSWRQQNQKRSVGLF